MSRAAFTTASKLYALISIASLKPSRLVAIVSFFKSSSVAKAIECSRKSICPNCSLARP